MHVVMLLSCQVHGLVLDGEQLSLLCMLCLLILLGMLSLLWLLPSDGLTFLLDSMLCTLCCSCPGG